MTFKSKMHPYDIGLNGSTPRTHGRPKGPDNARTIAEKLDAADGKIDGKISKDVWNKFAGSYGGNTIKNYITVDNAASSIARSANNESLFCTEGQGQYKLQQFMKNATNMADSLLGPADDPFNFNRQHYAEHYENGPMRSQNLPGHINRSDLDKFLEH